MSRRKFNNGDYVKIKGFTTAYYGSIAYSAYDRFLGLLRQQLNDTGWVAIREQARQITGDSMSFQVFAYRHGQYQIRCTRVPGFVFWVPTRLLELTVAEEPWE